MDGLYTYVKGPIENLAMALATNLHPVVIDTSLPYAVLSKIDNNPNTVEAAEDFLTYVEQNWGNNNMKDTFLRAMANHGYSYKLLDKQPVPKANLSSSLIDGLTPAAFRVMLNIHVLSILEELPIPLEDIMEIKNCTRAGIGIVLYEYIDKRWATMEYYLKEALKKRGQLWTLKV